jgi:hypothetical protein
LAGVACGKGPCDEVAELLRECCARGPAELRQGCEAEAKRLEEDGNTDACETALQRGGFRGCKE